VSCANTPKYFPLSAATSAFYQFPGEEFWKRLFDLAPPRFSVCFQDSGADHLQDVPDASALWRASRSSESLVLSISYCLQEAFLRPLEPYRERVSVLIFEFGAFAKGAFSGVREFLELLDPFSGLAAAPFPLRDSKSATRSFWKKDYFDCLAQSRNCGT